MMNEDAKYRVLTVVSMLMCILAIMMFTSCKPVKYLPVESVKTEYHKDIVRDSVFLYDSVFVKEKEDTVYLERYRYLYRDKIVRDSVLINDTIRVPYPVEIPVEVKMPLSGWENFQIWLGRALIGAVGVFCLSLYIRKKIKII
jgi:hypothetical protein